MRFLSTKIRKYGSLLLILLIVSILLYIPAQLIFSTLKNLIVDEMSLHAQHVACTISFFIEQDIDSYRQLSEIDDYDEELYDIEYYQKMNALFRTIKEDIDADYIYTAKLFGSDQVIYIFDAEDPDNELFTPIGTVDYLSHLENMVFESKKHASSGLYDYEFWGEYLSGIAPIIDHSDGVVVGIVGVDYGTESVNDLIAHVHFTVMASFGIIIILTTLVVYYLLMLRSKSQKIDYLTQVHSKRYFEQRLRDTVRDAHITKRSCVLLMIDIDNFKYINDTYGHQIGDAILKAVANILKLHIRVIDSCSRYGGDEFAIILPDITMRDAQITARRLLERVSELSCEEEQSLSGTITISIGIAKWTEGIIPAVLLEYADKALYQSKKSGKNRATVYSRSQ